LQDLSQVLESAGFILVGTDGSAGLVLRALRIGAKNFFTTPYSPGQVGAAIRDCADEASARLTAMSRRGADEHAPRLVGTSRLMCVVVDDDGANRPADGLIGVQVHVGPPMKVEYRHVRLKEF
jgi:DNA-binding NtrC family response regulator